MTIKDDILNFLVDGNITAARNSMASCNDEELNLSDRPLAFEAIEQIAALSSLSASIKKLYLRRNYINTPESVAALSSLPATLKALDLTGNRFQTKVIAALSNLPASITDLDVSKNCINSTKSINALAESLPASVKTLKIDIPNSFTDNSYIALLNLVKQTKITELIIDQPMPLAHKKAIYSEIYLSQHKNSLSALATLAAINVILANPTSGRIDELLNIPNDLKDTLVTAAKYIGVYDFLSGPARNNLMQSGTINSQSSNNLEHTN